MIKTFLSCKRSLLIGTVALVLIMPTISSSAEDSQRRWDNQWRLGGHLLREIVSSGSITRRPGPPFTILDLLRTV